MVPHSFSSLSLTDFQTTRLTLNEVQLLQLSLVQKLNTHMEDVTEDQVLMLNFKTEVVHIPTINLTQEKAVLNYPAFRGNIANDLDDDPITSAVVSILTTHQQIIHDELFSSTAPSHTGSGKATIVPSTSTAKNVPVTSLIINEQKMINRVKALVSKGTKPRLYSKLELRRPQLTSVQQLPKRREVMMVT